MDSPSVFLSSKGDTQSQAVVRSIARQVCEQLIQSEYALVGLDHVAS